MITLRINRRTFCFDDELMVLPEDTIDERRNVHRIAISSLTDGNVARKLFTYVKDVKVPIAKMVITTPVHSIEYQQVMPTFESKILKTCKKLLGKSNNGKADGKAQVFVEFESGLASVRQVTQ